MGHTSSSNLAQPPAGAVVGGVMVAAAAMSVTSLPFTVTEGELHGASGVEDAGQEAGMAWHNTCVWPHCSLLPTFFPGLAAANGQQGAITCLCLGVVKPVGSDLVLLLPSACTAVAQTE